MTRRINELKALMEAKDQEIQALIEKSKTYIREKAEAEQEGRSAEKTMDQHRETIVGHDHMLRGLQAQKINKLHSFGNRIPEVLQLIQREQWRGEMPVGPLGMFVEVKDQQWAHLMRLALGGLMSSWAVSDVGDRGRLNRILESCGKFVACFAS
jgi:chromosome segregation ATPase